MTKESSFFNVMIYVTQFETDLTKSFSQTAFHNIKSLQQKNINFEVRPLSRVLSWDESPEWIQGSKDYFVGTQSNLECALVHLLAMDLPKALYKSATKAIGVTAIETSMIPMWLAESLNETYKGLIVPSEFSKASLERSGVRIPIRAVPHALHPMWLQDYPSPPKKPTDRYVFGYVGYWNARKNPQGVLDAYLEAFPKDNGQTALLIKTFNAGNIEGYIQSKCGESREDIWVYDEMWSEAQMLWAFTMMDCFVSAHKGEGFGLALAQAAALGKPVIYTNYSAPCEWLSSDKGHHPLEFECIQVQKEDVTPAYEHMLDDKLEWANVKQTQLVEMLTQISSEKPMRGFAPTQLSDFRKFLSWDNVGDCLINAIESIMEKPLLRKDKINAE